MLPSIGSPKIFTDELENYIEICGAVHNYSFDIFAHCVDKRNDKLSDTRRYIEQEGSDGLHGPATYRIGGIPSACGRDYQGRRQRASHETTSHHRYKNASKHVFVLDGT